MYRTDGSDYINGIYFKHFKEGEHKHTDVNNNNNNNNNT